MDQAQPVSALGLGWEFWVWFALALFAGTLLGRLVP